MATSHKAKTQAPSAMGGFPGFDMPSMEDMSKILGQFQLSGFDASALLEWQRKEFEALAQANREACQGFLALNNRRQQLMQEAFVRWQESLLSATGPDALAKQTEAAHASVQKLVEDLRELSVLETQAWTSAWTVLQDRMQESMANLQAMFTIK